MAQGKKLSKEDERRILRAAQSMPINATAKTLGHSRNTVKKILKKNEKTT